MLQLIPRIGPVPVRVFLRIEYFDLSAGSFQVIAPVRQIEAFAVCRKYPDDVCIRRLYGAVRTDRHSGASHRSAARSTAGVFQRVGTSGTVRTDDQILFAGLRCVDHLIGLAFPCRRIDRHRVSCSLLKQPESCRSGRIPARTERSVCTCNIVRAGTGRGKGQTSVFISDRPLAAAACCHAAASRIEVSFTVFERLIRCGICPDHACVIRLNVRTGCSACGRDGELYSFCISSVYGNGIYTAVVLHSSENVITIRAEDVDFLITRSSRQHSRSQRRKQADDHEQDQQYRCCSFSLHLFSTLLFSAEMSLPGRFLPDPPSLCRALSLSFVDFWLFFQYSIHCNLSTNERVKGNI